MDNKQNDEIDVPSDIEYLEDLENYINRIKIDLIKTIYSEQNSFKIEEFKEIPLDKAMQLINQLQIFRKYYNYRFPKFVLNSTNKQILRYYDLLMEGYTLLEIEELYYESIRTQKVKTFQLNHKETQLY